MADTFFIEGLNTLPEQVQLNKEDIKTLNAKIDTITNSIANLGWELKTNTKGDKCYIPKNFDENIPYSLTNLDDSTQDSGLNIYKDTDGYVWSYLTIYIPADDDFVGIWTGHDNTDGYFCSLSMGVPNDKTTYIVVTYIANSDCPQSLNNDTYKEDLTIATMGWVNKYYLTKTDASNTYATKTELSNANERIDALDTGTFDVDLTTSGLAKIKANVTIGTPITLNKNTDFSQYLEYTNYKTVIFTLYIDDNEEYFISTDIKLNVGDTAEVYGDNNQNYTWLTGIGVIKLGPNTIGNNYLCYISYSQGYTSPLVITPIQKLA